MARHEMSDFGEFCEVQYPRLVGALRLQVGDDGVAEELAPFTWPTHTCGGW